MNTQEIQAFFLSYINLLEGSKTIIKGLHWGASKLAISDKRGAHIYLDELLNIVSDYQDTIAESIQGIIGVFLTPENVEGKRNQKVFETPLIFMNYLLKIVSAFYNNIPTDVEYQGIKSETETLIKDINKYTFLFTLC